MSPLAFDKQGKPFAWNARTRKLKVRLFRNPAARGTCCQVFDGAGAPLYIDADTDYAEFRRAIANVPGFYRLDQCDEDGVDIEGAPPAYVSIEHLRNAATAEPTASNAEVNPLVIIQSMAAIQADVMKTLAAQQSQLLAATAEIMRAPYRPAPAPVVVPASDLRNAQDEDDEEDENDGEQAEAKNEILGMIGPMLPTIAEKFGEQIGKRLMDAVTGIFAPKAPVHAAAPAATPAPMPVTYAAPAPAASGRHVAHAGVAAGQSAMQAAPPAPVAYPPGFKTEACAHDDRDVDDVEAAALVPHASSASAPSPAPAVASNSKASVAQASLAPVVEAPELEQLGNPTPDQMMHLFAISQLLTPKERARAERVIASMTPENRAQWIAALSTKSTEEAATEIRAALTHLQAKH